MTAASVRAFSDATTLDARVIRMALGAAACAREAGAVINDRLLTVIDYSKPSTEPRLWVLDLARERVLFEERVAHGQGSGDNYATRFSNLDGSHQTSLGLFRTADTYVGTNGYSLRLDGLEPGVNDRARDRAIVMHGAAVRERGQHPRAWAGSDGATDARRSAPRSPARSSTRSRTDRSSSPTTPIGSGSTAPASSTVAHNHRVTPRHRMTDMRRSYVRVLVVWALTLLALYALQRSFS